MQKNSSLVMGMVCGVLMGAWSEQALAIRYGEPDTTMVANVECHTSTADPAGGSGVSNRWCVTTYTIESTGAFYDYWQDPDSFFETYGGGEKQVGTVEVPGMTGIRVNAKGTKIYDDENDCNSGSEIMQPRVQFAVFHVAPLAQEKHQVTVYFGDGTSQNYIKTVTRGSNQFTSSGSCGKK